MNTILALDLSKTSTGFAYGRPDGRPATGSQRFGTSQHEDHEVGAKALRWLTHQLAVMQPDIVAIEAAWEGNGQHSAHTSSLLLGLQFLVQTVAFIKTGRRPILVKVGAARKSLTGRGTYPKGEAKAAVQAECLRRGWMTADTLQADAADALAVWCHVAAEQNPDLDYRRAIKAQPMAMGA
ncbi:hypothetical protein [Pelagibacterium lentulum]|uniref:Holliday junction nuclease RuvC n=1 Tax=Pelagibacterium lentulum TaxID=2029865 RepID=A0A916W455_9HYPH|nr:hypothetical protein [Pelagibacterium lentulum]GGA64741.1 hypothetical protein GCM10011499_39010 [Pelagibacterium lentulum]